MIAAEYEHWSVVKVLMEAAAATGQVRIWRRPCPKKNIKKQQQNTECVICMNSPKTHAFIPCGHRCVCKKCGESCIDNNYKCPLCRKKTTGIIKIYF
ncbi:MAG: RING-HC finger protein [Candidatus Actinomarina sp.]|nr:RING-HC finger protein [Candidatus Actinomarina sp.]